LEVKFGIDEGKMVCEAGNIVGEPSYNYATHKGAGYGSRKDFMIKLGKRMG
jgi:hypothetical protein